MHCAMHLYNCLVIKISDCNDNIYMECIKIHANFQWPQLIPAPVTSLEGLISYGKVQWIITEWTQLLHASSTYKNGYSSILGASVPQLFLSQHKIQHMNLFLWKLNGNKLGERHSCKDKLLTQAFEGVRDHCKDPRVNVSTHPFNRFIHDVGSPWNS